MFQEAEEKGIDGPPTRVNKLICADAAAREVDDSDFESDALGPCKQPHFDSTPTLSMSYNLSRRPSPHLFDTTTLE